MSDENMFAYSNMKLKKYSKMISFAVAPACMSLKHKNIWLQHRQKIGINPRLLITSFEMLVQKEIAEGTIKSSISGKQLILNIMSLCVYPFVARSIVQTMMQMDDPAFMTMIEQRKKEVTDLIINGIKI